jgi:uncharacterized membrane protein (DUF485 family)
MDIVSSLAVVALAGLIHASFQLGVSMLTLLSGHSIGIKRSQARVLRLTTAFVLGAGTMTVLLLSFVSLVLLSVFGNDVPVLAWAVACGLTFGVGVAIWMFYYRKGKGTGLWIPRPVADFLNERTKATKRSVESYSLGLISVLGEIIFLIAPLSIAALVLIGLDPLWQLAGIAIYTVVSLISIDIVHIMVGSGHKLSNIQKWRETHKRFLQFIAGSGLIVLGFYVYVATVVGASVGGV